MKMAGTVVAFLFHVVLFRKGRDKERAPRNLANAIEDDLGAAVIKFDRTLDFDQVSRKPAHIADIFQIAREDHDGKWAGHLVFTKVEEVNPLRSDFNLQNSSADACGFAYVSAGFMDRDAVGSHSSARGEQDRPPQSQGS